MNSGSLLRAGTEPVPGGAAETTGLAKTVSAGQNVIEVDSQPEEEVEGNSHHDEAT